MARGIGGIIKGGSRRTAMGAFVAAGLVALAAWMLFQTVDRLTAHQNRRSFHDLAMVTDSLAGWPRTIRAMAATNMLPGRLTGVRADRARGEDGQTWQAQARFWHPDLGNFDIRYRLAGPAGCGEEPSGASKGTLLSATELVVRGGLPLDRLIEDDKAAGSPAERHTAAGFIAWLNTGSPQARPAPTLAATDARTICYEARLRLAEMIDLARVAPGFSHLLLAENDQVRAQLATDRLALFDLGRLPVRETLVRTVAQQSGVKIGEPPPSKLGDALEPVKTSVAGVDYLAYVRRFALTDAEPATAVALVPESQIRARVLRPDPLAMALFEFAVLLLLTVTPVIKLRLIGESEALEKLEVTALALGTLAAAAVLTLLVAFAIDVTARRGAVDDRLADTATTLRDQFARDMHEMVSPLRDVSRIGGPCADGLPFATAYVPRIDLRPGRPDDPIEPRIVAQEIGSGTIRLPLVESVFIVGNDSGKQVPGSYVVTCRADTVSPVEVGARLDVSTRDYWKDARSGRVDPLGLEVTPLTPDRSEAAAPPDLPRPLWLWRAHSSDAVRSQSDGVIKTLLGFPAWFDAKTPRAPDDPPISPNAVAAVAANLRSFTTPVLGDGQRFMVVDLDKPGLPVLFHSNPTRALVERFVDETRDVAVARRIVIRLQHEKLEKPLKFVADYDGEKQRFAAVALPRTSWALLIWRPSAEPERTALETVNWALILWAACGLLLGGTVLVLRWLGRALIVWRIVGRGADRLRTRLRYRAIRMRVGRWARRSSPLFARFWRTLFDWFDPSTPRRLSSLFWIDPRRTAAYRGFALALGALQLVLAILLLWAPRGHVWLALASIALTLVALLWLNRQPLDHRIRVLTAASERQFRRAFVGVVIGLAILPAAAFYLDANALSARTRDFAEYQQRTSALMEREEALRGIARSFYPSVRTMVAPRVDGSDRGRADPDWFRLVDHPDAGLTETLQTAEDPMKAQPRLFCRGCAADGAGRVQRGAGAIETVEQGSDTSAAGNRGFYVGTADLAGKLSVDTVEWASIGFAAAGATALLAAIIGTIFTQLFGVGRPIESTPYPLFPPERAGRQRQSAGPRNALDDLELNPKTMIVDPPLFVQQTLFDYGAVIDLAAERFAPIIGSEAPNAAQPLHVFHNLELTLRHPERRLAALARLEAVVAREAVRNGKEWVVLLSDLSPLERLLQAYERDREEIGSVDNSVKAEQIAQLKRNREDIRWSRLLEDFQTYIFETLPKVDVARRGTNLVRRRILSELAPLPENVIATLLPPGAIDNDMVRFEAGMSREDRKRALDQRYGPAVARWADGLQAPSEAAAVDFLAQMLIEHYEQLWASSSRSERLLLHHLAHGRAISMAAINPLSSLIRRGLVTMEPMPRLMNHSFEQFVRRAEKPARVAAWRAEAPRGAWQRAAGPLLVILPLGLLAIVYVVIESGQPAASLLPLMAAAGPALLQTLGMIRRSNAA